MIKQIRPAFYHNLRNSQYCALSTDSIPSYLENGDEVYFIDSGKIYIWNSVTDSLVEKKQVSSLPPDGLDGQVLFKDTNSEFGASWGAIVEGMSIVKLSVNENGILSIISTQGG